MNLNKFHKEIIVNGVMKDTPKIDYQEQARQLIMKNRLEELPDKVRQLWEDKNLREYIRTDSVYINSVLSRVGPFPTNDRTPILPELLSGKLREITEAAWVQRDNRKKLRDKLEAALAPVRTRKQALERFPEFEKYLPADTDTKADRSLPAIANVMTDLMAAGWPKDKKPEVKVEAKVEEKPVAKVASKVKPRTKRAST
jgi:hypothetical protein